MQIANRESFAAASRRRPRMVRVQYIESTGTQWIDTGVKIALTDRVAVDFARTGSASDTNGAACGARVSYAAANGFAIWAVTAANIARFDLTASSSQYVTISATVTVGTRHVAEKTGATNRLDGYDVAGNGTVSSYSPQYNAYLFAVNQAGSAAFPAKMRLYAATIGDKRDFVPVRVGNAGYLYDRVSGQLFANAGTGSFAVGPDAPFDSSVEYLGFDGAQYIDTGYTAYGEFAMDMEFMITQIAGNTVYSGVRSSSQLLHVPQVSGEGGDFRFYYGAGDVPSVETAAATLNVRHVAHAQLTRALRVCEIDGRVVARAATSVSPITTDLSIYVGKRNFYGASDTVLAMVGRLYGFRLFRNGTYARDLQPVSSGGVGYMWDSVSNTLLANAGTGSFAVGPDKTA